MQSLSEKSFHDQSDSHIVQERKGIYRREYDSAAAVIGVSIEPTGINACKIEG